MSDEDRDRLRALQDRWLALGVVQTQIRNYGEDESIVGVRGKRPTFADVRTLVLPDWEQWFGDFFQ